jgi:YbgC/YbaW family acyl-CoA thioester hydrolase
MGFSFKRSFIVGWGDCAPSGAVYYPNYFRWFDQSVWDLFDAAGLPIPELEHAYGVVGLPLMSLSCNFRAPCRLRDRVSLETRIATIEPKHFTVISPATIAFLSALSTNASGASAPRTILADFGAKPFPRRSLSV